jgi:hypothetical protein
LKTKSPSGATRGASPPKKWPHFFTKFAAKVLSMPRPKLLGESTRGASSQRAKKRESGIAHASSRIPPFPLAAPPTAYLFE